MDPFDCIINCDPGFLLKVEYPGGYGYVVWVGNIKDTIDYISPVYKNYDKLVDALLDFAESG